MLILEALKKRIAETPDKICISSPEETFTFLEVDFYSNGIAKKIISLTSKKIIPLYLKDDKYVLPIVLGIIKAGKIPMPLTTSLPLEKSLLRVEDVDYDLIIMCKENRFSPKSSSVFIAPDKKNLLGVHNFRNNISDIAYIICTSGTTGVPKKVFLTQKNIAWLLSEFRQICSFDENCKFLFSTPYTFDVSISEIFLPIFTGGELCCFSNTLKDTEKMTAVIPYIKKFNITHISLSPSYVELLLEISKYDDFKNLKYLGLGGEAVSLSLSKKLLPILKNGTEVINMYGPSETTIYATFYKLTGKETDSVPIGIPLTGTLLKILDEQGDETLKGELFIGGEGVSAGYLLQPELSKKKFIDIDGEIFYRTGDFVYHNTQGELVFETRKDNQVQVNGIRVELEEIDNTVLKISGIRLCRTVYEKKRIYIFYYPVSSSDDLKKEILESIPNYLNPIIIKVDEFLLNQNRKFDVKRMIEKFYSQKEISIDSQVTQEELIKILKKYDVKSLDELDSLDTVRFFLEVEDAFDIKIDDSLFFSFSSLAQLSDFLKQKKSFKPMINQDKNLDEINLKMIVENSLNKNNLEEGLIPTLYHQKTYYLKKYNSILYFDSPVEDINYKILNDIKVFFQSLSYHIDSLKFVLTEKDSLYLKKIKQEDFQPIIYAVENELPDKLIKDLLHEKLERYLFLIIAEVKEKNIRVYFSHHIMDKSSLFKIAKLIKNYLNNDNGEYFHGIDSSYESYIKFIKDTNSSLSIEEALEFIPVTEVTFSKNIDRKKSNIQIMQSKNIFNDSIDIAVESFYKFSQCLFNKAQVSLVTGAMTANIRNLENFDAENIVGDTHFTLPIFIKNSDNFFQFKKRIVDLTEKYRKGLNIKDKIFEGYPRFEGAYKIAKNRWDNVNAIVNYIGEVTDIQNTLKKISEVGFDSNYMVVFTHKSELYQVIFCNVLLEEEYHVEILGESYAIEVSRL